MKARELPLQNEDKEVGLLIQAFRDKVSKKISCRELYESCYIWSYCYCFSAGGYLPEPLPSKPFALVKFSSLTQSEAKALSEDSVSALKTKLMEYLELKDKALHSNRSNKVWLEKMADYFKYKGQEDRVGLINERIKLYEGVC